MYLIFIFVQVEGKKMKLELLTLFATVEVETPKKKSDMLRRLLKFVLEIGGSKSSLTIWTSVLKFSKIDISFAAIVLNKLFNSVLQLFCLHLIFVKIVPSKWEKIKFLLSSDSIW